MNDEPPIATVGVLIRHLQKFSADTPVIYRSCSDWAPLYINDVKLVEGVSKSYWVMSVYAKQVPTMSDENRRSIQAFVGFPGN